MSITLIAVVIALVVGHTLPTLVALRRYDWFIHWLEWLGLQLGAREGWRGAWGLLIALGPPLLLVLLLQVGLRGAAYGLLSFLFALAALFYAWGPRDLDHDVEAVVEAENAEARRAAAARLFPERGEPRLDGGALVEAVFRCALWRWFGVLFWFLLLGPFGALLYRLVALCAQGEAARRLPEGAVRAARTTLAVLDWPVAQLMTLALALVANFDSVFTAWKDAGGARASLDRDFLGAAARASVRRELAEEAFEDMEPGAEIDAYAAEAVVTTTTLPGLPELRDAMSLVWRVLLLWLAALALFVIAGWVA